MGSKSPYYPFVIKLKSSEILVKDSATSLVKIMKSVDV